MAHFDFSWMPRIYALMMNADAASVEPTRLESFDKRAYTQTAAKTASNARKQLNDEKGVAEWTCSTWSTHVKLKAPYKVKKADVVTIPWTRYVWPSLRSSTTTSIHPAA